MTSRQNGDKSTFSHISSNPQAKDEYLPTSPFWHIRDILANARMVLRRRTAAEISERASILKTMLLELRTYMEELVSEVPEQDAILLPKHDDADILECLMLPDRTYPFQRTPEENIKGLPWAAETGWIEAEDLAVLALTKVDTAIGQLSADVDETTSAAVNLLDAYRCCLLAVQRGGLRIQTEEEALEAIEFISTKQNELLTLKKQFASSSRKHQGLKALVVERYKQLQAIDPSISKRKLAKQIAEEYETPTPLFSNLDGCLKGANAEDRFEQIYKWIQKADKEAKRPIPDDSDILLHLDNLNRKHSY